ncbi:MAG: NAD(P)/FAD-dependent oxidoreductase [Lachnospiraceae bacterium]|nr:NAD(P)/FAD-dependent oxidoreductase [Lachnospiraceae bacterium]
MEKWELIIVGAGPAGLMAAKTAAEKGIKVVVIEKKRNFDTVQRACSMQFILDDGYEGEKLEVKENRLVFTKNGFEVSYQGDLVEIRNKYYHSPKNRIIHFALPENQPFALKFDKQKLLAGLYKECKEAGVVFQMESVAVGGEDCGEEVRVEVSANGVSTSFWGKKLIISEGVNAVVSEKFGLNKGRIHYATAHVVKYVLEGVTGIEPNSWNLYYGKTYHTNSPAIIGPSMYGDNIVEMTLTGDANIRPTDIFEKLKESSPLAAQLQNARVLKKTGCSVKGFASMMMPYQQNVIAIGDTAAFVEVEVQGALMCGYKSALAVAEELEGKPGFEEYTRWWRQSFEFNGEDHLRVSQGYALVPTYTDEELDYLFGLIEGSRLEGTYSQYKTPKLIWDEILTHQQQIEEEAPQIYKKIQNMNTLTLSSSFSK